SGTGRAIRRLRVTVVAGPAKGKSWSEAMERCAIGSHPSNDLVIEDGTVSRFHCELAIADTVVRVRDLGSRNGTLMNDASLLDALVGRGCVLGLGDSEIRIDIDPEEVDLAASERSHFGELIGDSTVMREVFSQLEKIAASTATVLI